MEKLRKLFGGKQPSVRLFKALIAHLSEEEQQQWYIDIYQLMFLNYPGHPKRYRAFFLRLLKHDWQKFHDIIMGQSILADVRYKLQYPEEFKKMCHLLEGIQTNVNGSFSQLAFVVLLAFDYSLSVSTMRNQLRDTMFTPEELWDIIGKATIDTGEKG